MQQPAERDDPAPDELLATGQRIQALLEASSTHGAIARERSEELVRLVADLYGAGIERILDLVYEAGRLDDDVLDALAGDQLVAGLLLVHGLHPYDVTSRVEKALDDVRPYLGSHGGDVELLGVSEHGVVRLRLLGSCDGCPSSSVTLKLAVEGAVEAAAPEVTGIEVETADGDAPAAGGLIPVSALRARIDHTAPADNAGAWEAMPDLARPGAVGA
jgi:Fe-S cluster biogenesis protein NfuA